MAEMITETFLKCLLCEEGFDDLDIAKKHEPDCPKRGDLYSIEEVTKERVLRPKKKLGVGPWVCPGYEPGESSGPMNTDPNCKICGATKRSHG